MLASCGKEDVTPQSPVPTLTGKAKQVNDLVWGKTFTDTNTTATIGSEIVWIDVNGNRPDDKYSFTVTSTSAYTRTEWNPGSGVSYKGIGNGVVNYEVTAVMLDESPGEILLSIRVDENTLGHVIVKY